MACAMDMELNFGQMVPDMRVCGVMIRLMAKESLYTLMEIYTRASGSTIKRKVQALIHMQMEPTMKVNGRMISNMGTELSHGQMVRDMRASTKMERKKDKVD